MGLDRADIQKVYYGKEYTEVYKNLDWAR